MSYNEAFSHHIKLLWELQLQTGRWNNISQNFQESTFHYFFPRDIWHSKYYNNIEMRLKLCNLEPGIVPWWINTKNQNNFECQTSFLSFFWAFSLASCSMFSLARSCLENVLPSPGLLVKLSGVVVVNVLLSNMWNRFILYADVSFIWL